MPLVDAFPRRERKLADILRDSMLEMYRLATRLERKYYKKTTLEDLDIELAVLKEFVIVASDKDYRGQKYAPPLTLHQREVWSSFNKEIGCMIGGYMESVKNGPAKKDKNIALRLGNGPLILPVARIVVVTGTMARTTAFSP